jgi:hypothetical protein
MKTPSLLIALLFTTTLPAHSQILGIFEQGAEELKEYGQQIAALELLLTRQQKGYQIIESGLYSISSITGNEYNLHQNYYNSLPKVNPSISRSPDLDEFVSIRSLISTDLIDALERWNKSAFLTSNDGNCIISTSANITKMSLSQSVTFMTLTSGDAVPLTDDQRIGMISDLLDEVRSLYAYTQAFIDQVDLLILNRRPPGDPSAPVEIPRSP